MAFYISNMVLVWVVIGVSTGGTCPPPNIKLIPTALWVVYVQVCQETGKHAHVFTNVKVRHSVSAQLSNQNAIKYHEVIFR